MLAELGYGLDLPEGIDPARRYHYDPDQGRLETGGEIPGSALIALREERFASREGQFITANTLAALGNAKLGYEVRYDQCKCEGFWPRAE